ncbi:DNA methyltransferase [Paenibacillus odorifer]|uniref:DNA adenine methylase n=1 Tax=Paenibacillus odorifer TaxID=189426 RepID=UPI00096D1312|nr:Dam family site-specific DNA-(adenine-N6)-methyltransferase [Paenibacillus odorifer]OMD83445.1 DNA methyltransferase [Paenibacillus odorifer]
MSDQLVPFLKWAGGKRWFTQRYARMFPQNFNLYIEPFLGGGSVFFHLKPQQALLGDLNEDLINAYSCIRDDWEPITNLLVQHQLNHCVDYYYHMRETIPTNLCERAARLIYLNRTCFNGIYRVNRQGMFNVPKGTKDSVVFETDDFEKMSITLLNAELRTSDFEPLIEEANHGDFIFADPPYTVRHNQNGFIKYNENLFSWNDQIRLAAALRRAYDRGAIILSSNANHHLVRELYEDQGFNIETVSRYSSISADPSKRKQYEEIIISANIH